MSYEYNKALIQYAKELRKNATKEERKLWYDFLSEYEIRFQRQKIIGNYIADFYCANVKLIIELDGSQHFTEQSKNYDSERTQCFKELGITVIRFTNTDINSNFSGVCTIIDIAVKRMIRQKHMNQ